MLGLSAWGSQLAQVPPRTLREQEAEVFREVTASLRSCLSDGASSRLEALARNRQLWTTLIGTLTEPGHKLPASLRGRLISIGLAVQREMQGKVPDFEFLIMINEQVMAGLKGA